MSIARLSAAPHAPPSPCCSWRQQLVVLLFATIARLVCASGQSVIGADSCRFLAAAESVEAGDLLALCRQDYHPLTAFCIGKLNGLQSWVVGESSDFRERQAARERAAVFLSLVSGLVLVCVLLDLSRRLFPDLPPLMLGLLAALHPYFVRASADIMSDALFLALIALALRQAVLASERRGWLTVASAGGLVGIAYLARPEALALLPAFAVYWWLSMRRERVRLAAWILLAGATALLLVVPYMITLHNETGQWLITRKKSIDKLFSWKTAHIYVVEPTVLRAGIGLAVDDFWAIWRVFTRWYFATSEALAVASILGLGFIHRRREWRAGHVLFGVTAALLALVLVRVCQSEGANYVTKRHAYALAFLSLPFAARGLIGLAGWVRAWVARYGWLRALVPSRFDDKIQNTILVLVLLPLAVKGMAPQRSDQQAERAAADYIFARGGAGQSVLSPLEKIAYYAGGTDVFQLGSADSILALIADRREAWVAFYRDDLDEIASGLSARLAAEIAGGRLTLIESFSEGRHAQLDLYRWKSP
ncbi:MAG: glycosyltransferase family 39 protein [Planctomycetota bacterium]